MAIKIDEKGAVRIQGRIPRRFQSMVVEKRASQRGVDPKGVPSILADALLEVEPQFAKEFSASTVRDDELIRRDLSAVEGGIGQVVQDRYLALAGAIENISKDLALSREGKREKMWSAVEDFMSKIVEAGSGPLAHLLSLEVQILELFKGAIDPEIPDDKKVEYELQKREVRDFLRLQNESDRAATALNFGKSANLVALEAIERDPLGNGLVSKDALDAAKETAVVAQGGEWIIQEQKSAEKSVDAAKRRIHFLERCLLNGLVYRGLVGVEDYPFGSLLQKMEGDIDGLEEYPFFKSA